MSKVTATAILGLANILKPEPINLPDIDGDTYIKRMTTAERLALEADMSVDDDSEVDSERVYAVVFAHSLCDSDGKLIFDTTQIKNGNLVDELSKLPFAITNAVFQKSNKINGVNTQATDEKN